MKNLKLGLGVAALAAVLGTTLASSNALAWGDSTEKGRETYTVEEIKAGKSGDKIFFNSISDSVDGNELYFVSARSEEMKTWNTDELTVEDGKTYLVRLYVHNNNPYGESGKATGVKVGYVMPTGSAKELKISGTIDSANATPTSYWDSVVLKANQNFHLEYVAGSATIANNGKLNGTKLSDSIINGNVQIGYDSLNGELPGCFQYAAYIGIKVKVVYDYDFEISKTVRNVTNGDKTWSKQVYAKEGDTVEYQIYYKNTSGVSEKIVQILDKLGSNQTYVKGSTKLYNAVNPKGLAITSDEITGKGISIGDYAAGAEAYIRFRVTVKNNNLGCGADNVLRSWAQGYIGSNATMKQDYADVLVRLACPETPEKPPVTPVEPTTPTTPTKIPETGPASVAGLVLGAGSLTTAAGAFVASRKRF